MIHFLKGFRGIRLSSVIFAKVGFLWKGAITFNFKAKLYISQVFLRFVFYIFCGRRLLLILKRNLHQPSVFVFCVLFVCGRRLLLILKRNLHQPCVFVFCVLFFCGRRLLSILKGNLHQPSVAVINLNRFQILHLNFKPHILHQNTKTHKMFEIKTTQNKNTKTHKMFENQNTQNI